VAVRLGKPPLAVSPSLTTAVYAGEFASPARPRFQKPYDSWLGPPTEPRSNRLLVVAVLFGAPVMEEFIDDRNPSPGDDPPVTAVASRRVKPGREREFEEWVSGILAAANRFPGYLGSEVFRLIDPEDNEYKIISHSHAPAFSHS
jgi:antibiotic biosynthesis monooxygenase (ABM) superfamily enzyme